MPVAPETSFLREFLQHLLESQEDRIKEDFKAFIEQSGSQPTIDEIAKKVAEHEIDNALEILDSYIEQFANTVPKVITRVGEEAARELTIALPDIPIAISFNPTNPRAAEIIADARLRLVRDLTQQQEVATRLAISNALSQGAGTQQIGRAVRESIGLTPQQMDYVASYRRLLENKDPRALERALRDRRFDSRMLSNRPLTQRQIDVMVERYRARTLALRADTIARTEALTAYSIAREEALQQMVEQTRLNSQRVVRVWYATHDDRVRDWHLSMDGQRQGIGEPFIDGLGNVVRYPGDPLSPPETRINCRCTLGFDVLDAA